jgi:hypothetical protein|tara:strand:+ start:1065 stop:1316 length:252 start_codon:yes stop_codon:yes gene_type:complete
MTKDPLIEELYKGKVATYPSVVVSGSGDAWFLNPETRSMERIYRGSVAKKISLSTDSKGRHLVQVGTIYILVPEEELFSVGDN